VPWRASCSAWHQTRRCAPICRPALLPKCSWHAQVSNPLRLINLLRLAEWRLWFTLSFEWFRLGACMLGILLRGVSFGCTLCSFQTFATMGLMPGLCWPSRESHRVPAALAWNQAYAVAFPVCGSGAHAKQTAFLLLRTRETPLACAFSYNMSGFLFLDQLNSQAASQSNSRLQALADVCSLITQPNFIRSLRFFFGTQNATVASRLSRLLAHMQGIRSAP